MNNRVSAPEVPLNPYTSWPSSLANDFFQILLASVLISCLYSRYEPEVESYTAFITLWGMMLDDSVSRFFSIVLRHHDSLDVGYSSIIGRWWSSIWFGMRLSVVVLSFEYILGFILKIYSVLMVSLLIRLCLSWRLYLLFWDWVGYIAILVVSAWLLLELLFVEIGIFSASSIRSRSSEFWLLTDTLGRV